MKKIYISIISSILLMTACRPVPVNNDGRLTILTSTSILADITGNVVGTRAKVVSLLPFGADPHSYQAAPSDVARIADSKVLIINGVEYEHFIEPLLKNAGGERLTITASNGMTPQSMTEDGVPVGDPHMWLDPTRVVTYVENIRDSLIKIDPSGQDIYRTNANTYISQLKGLDAWIKQQVNTIPAKRRLLVTNHDAMGYFAERYGFTVIGAVIPSFSSEAGTSAQKMAALVDQIKASGAPAIFLGQVENTVLANQVAQETGVKVVNDLYLESLTDGAPAGTYIDMMKHNVSRIVEALK
jgi:ABC-type Zn uptake system ZnuABC Zn-binding protein ZnuA